MPTLWGAGGYRASLNQRKHFCRTKVQMRQRRSSSAENSISVIEPISVTDDTDIKDKNGKHKSGYLKTCKSECMVAFVLLLTTLIISFILFICYGHFVLCWLNVGMCTPLIDVARIAYQLSTNSSSLNTLNDIDPSSMELDIHHICDSYQSSANFKLVLLFKSSSQQFYNSSVSAMRLFPSGVYLDSAVENDHKSLQDIYTEYSLWRRANQDIYIKVIYLDDFKFFSEDLNVYRYIDCHQIGVVWILSFDDINNEQLQMIINNMTFYKYGGIRHSIFYYEQLESSNKNRYMSMLHRFIRN